jgi:pyruvate/2-oxoglutarate dehydrogenase complex dihydrolipoamide dehydrogenase (E3) component
MNKNNIYDYVIIGAGSAGCVLFLLVLRLESY